MSANAIAAQNGQALSPADRRRLLSIEEAAAILDVSVPTLKRMHFADPDEYPAVRIGVLWKVPRAWVEAKTAWPREVRP